MITYDTTEQDGITYIRQWKETIEGRWDCKWHRITTIAEDLVKTREWTLAFCELRTSKEL